MARRNRSIGRKHGDSQSGLWWQAGDLNDMSYLQYYNKLTELSVSMFEWVNLPDTMDARFLELALFYDGHAVVFKDEVMGMLGLRCMMSGMWDVYKVPESRRAFAANGYTNELNPENSVIVWNNFLRTNSLLDVQLFATRLANIPTPGEEEVLCWEYTCQTDEGRRCMVYVNGQTGTEEKILLLIEDESGTLVQ